MSILTRVLVVALLVMSLIYLGMTAALFSYRTDYKNEWIKEKAAHEATIKDKKKEIDSHLAKQNALEKDINLLVTETKTLDANFKAATNDLTNWIEKNTQLNNEFTKLTTNYEKLQADLEAQAKKNDDLQKFVEDFRKSKEVAEKDRATFEGKFMQTQDDLLKLEKNLMTLEEQYLVQAKELNYAKTLLEQYKKQVPSVNLVEKAPKWIEGKILAISDKADLNLVVISVGKNDGVEVGMKFTVYRIDKYVGKVQIEKVDPQISSGFSIKEFAADAIKVGDSITTSPY
jgi:septal ring factor EnvC (AmiA/AmiB activator)